MCSGSQGLEHDPVAIRDRLVLACNAREHLLFGFRRPMKHEQRGFDAVLLHILQRLAINDHLKTLGGVGHYFRKGTQVFLLSHVEAIMAELVEHGEKDRLAGRHRALAGQFPAKVPGQEPDRSRLPLLTELARVIDNRILVLRGGQRPLPPSRCPLPVALAADLLRQRETPGLSFSPVVARLAVRSTVRTNAPNPTRIRLRNMSPPSFLVGSAAPENCGLCLFAVDATA